MKMNEEKKWWYFTFKEGTRHRKKFFKLYGTVLGTRREANKRYHDDWSAQYAEELWDALSEGKTLEQFLAEEEANAEQGKTV